MSPALAALCLACLRLSYITGSLTHPWFPPCSASPQHRLYKWHVCVKSQDWLVTKSNPTQDPQVLFYHKLTHSAQLRGRTLKQTRCVITTPHLSHTFAWLHLLGAAILHLCIINAAIFLLKRSRLPAGFRSTSSNWQKLVSQCLEEHPTCACTIKRYLPNPLTRLVKNWALHYFWCVFTLKNFIMRRNVILLEASVKVVS